MPAVFRNAGYVARTINDVFGLRPVEDVEWIRYADDNDMVVVCKDARIRYNQLELRALYYSRLRVLCLGKKGLRSEEQADYFARNLGRFERLWRRHESRPWIYAVRRDSIDLLPIRRPDEQ